MALLLLQSGLKSFVAEPLDISYQGRKKRKINFMRFEIGTTEGYTLTTWPTTILNITLIFFLYIFDLFRNKKKVTNYLTSIEQNHLKKKPIMLDFLKSINILSNILFFIIFYLYKNHKVVEARIPILKIYTYFNSWFTWFSNKIINGCR